MISHSISYFFQMQYYYIVSFLGEGRSKLHLSTYYVTATVVSALYELSHFLSQNLGFLKHRTE